MGLSQSHRATWSIKLFSKNKIRKAHHLPNMLRAVLLLSFVGAALAGFECADKSEDCPDWMANMNGACAPHSFIESPLNLAREILQSAFLSVPTFAAVSYSCRLRFTL